MVHQLFEGVTGVTRVIHLLTHFKWLQKFVRSRLTILRHGFSVKFSRELNAEEPPQKNKEAPQQNKEAPQLFLEAPKFFLEAVFCSPSLAPFALSKIF